MDVSDPGCTRCRWGKKHAPMPYLWWIMCEWFTDCHSTGQSNEAVQTWKDIAHVEKFPKHKQRFVLVCFCWNNCSCSPDLGHNVVHISVLVYGYLICLWERKKRSHAGCKTTQKRKQGCVQCTLQSGKINTAICNVRPCGYKGIHLIILSHKPAGCVLLLP